MARFCNNASYTALLYFAKMKSKAEYFPGEIVVISQFMVGTLKMQQYVL
jgi:hypothetical protein